MPLQILGGQFRASLVWLNASGGGCLLWKCAAGKLEASGGPRARFLFGTEMDEDEQALQIKHGALEAHITCLRFHVAEVAELSVAIGPCSSRASQITLASSRMRPSA